MALNFKDLAVKATSLSQIMEGRTKVSTNDMIDKYPDGFTINGFDYVANKKGEKYCVFTIEEDDTIFVNGATVIQRIFDEFVDSMGGDVDAASRELKRQGGLEVKFSWGQTKSGDQLVQVTVL